VVVAVVEILLAFPKEEDLVAVIHLEEVVVKMVDLHSISSERYFFA